VEPSDLLDTPQIVARTTEQGRRAAGQVSHRHVVSAVFVGRNEIAKPRTGINLGMRDQKGARGQSVGENIIGRHAQS